MDSGQRSSEVTYARGSVADLGPESTQPKPRGPPLVFKITSRVKVLSLFRLLHGKTFGLVFTQHTRSCYNAFSFLFRTLCMYGIAEISFKDIEYFVVLILKMECSIHYSFIFEPILSTGMIHRPNKRSNL